MGDKTRPAPERARRPDSRGNGGTRGEVDTYRVSVSRRIWFALAALGGLAIAAGVGMFMARGELAGLRVALQRAELQAADAERKLQDALADKQTLMRELAVQGTIAETTSEGSEKRAADLAAEVEELKKQLAEARKAAKQAKGEAGKLKSRMESIESELGVTLVKLAEAQAELQRLRGSPQPYGVNPALPYGPNPGQGQSIAPGPAPPQPITPPNQ